MSNTTRLWCMHAIGPDDVHAAPSKEAAEAACAWYTQRFAEQTRAGDVLLRFEAAEWPHSKESHAEDLLRWETEVMPPANAALSGKPAGDAPK